MRKLLLSFIFISTIGLTASVNLKGLIASPLEMKTPEKTYCIFQKANGDISASIKNNICDEKSKKGLLKITNVKVGKEPVKMFAMHPGTEFRIAAQKLSGSSYRLVNGQKVNYKALNFQSVDGQQGFLVVSKLKIFEFQNELRGISGGDVSD